MFVLSIQYVQFVQVYSATATEKLSELLHTLIQLQLVQFFPVTARMLTVQQSELSCHH